MIDISGVGCRCRQPTPEAAVILMNAPHHRLMMIAAYSSIYAWPLAISGFLVAFGLDPILDASIAIALLLLIILLALALAYRDAGGS